MRYYETLYLINPNLGEEEYRDVVSKFNGLVEKNNGVIIKVHEWGKRSLAYSVKKYDKGYYVLLQYCGDPGTTKELERDLRLDDRTFKFQTVKLNDKADPEALKLEAEKARGSVREESEETSALEETKVEEKTESQERIED